MFFVCVLSLVNIVLNIHVYSLDLFYWTCFIELLLSGVLAWDLLFYGRVSPTAFGFGPTSSFGMGH